MKSLAALLPDSVRLELRRLHYRRQIRLGRFSAAEPEFDMLPALVTHGDVVIDVGANVGHYAHRLSELVGPNGRVLAFEPFPETFALLAANARWFRYDNVTLFNTALSSACRFADMYMPDGRHGMRNHYQSRISIEGDTAILCLRLDDLPLPRAVTLVKVDAEGHEEHVIKGMMQLIGRDRPRLIVEGPCDRIRDLLGPLGYGWSRLPGSPNSLFAPHQEVDR